MTPFSLENDIEFQETEELLLIYTLVGPVDTWSTCMPIICTHVTTATVILLTLLLPKEWLSSNVQGKRTLETTNSDLVSICLRKLN